MTQTTQHDSPGTLSFLLLKISMEIRTFHPNGSAKCRWRISKTVQERCIKLVCAKDDWRMMTMMTVHHKSPIYQPFQRNLKGCKILEWLPWAGPRPFQGRLDTRRLSLPYPLSHTRYRALNPSTSKIIRMCRGEWELRANVLWRYRFWLPRAVRTWTRNFFFRFLVSVVRFDRLTDFINIAASSAGLAKKRR